MSKLYDFKKAKHLIEREKATVGQELVSVDLGMQEDWFWTAQEVWNQKEGDQIDFNTKNWIGGIDGSSWATPTIKFCYSDEKTKTLPCWMEGEQERDPEVTKLLEEFGE